ncbi:DUF4148 domain-containing protein [Herbaspirillum autotrophicum]|uniref:DUF4148 domain-containing protein n=1 Tax=Herbaspirillum autotrophicum TaxID=180195 RepID=UPI00067C0FFB|nr:DUF4148 domain-containing protein [Herbaspirillum autotrophicum]
MNTKQLTAAVILFAAAGAAMADAPYPPASNFVSIKSHADVIAELQQARAQGLISARNEYPIQPQVKQHLSREQVASQSAPTGTRNLYTGA